MDVVVYCNILKWRGENPYTLVESDKNKSIPVVEKVFRQDIYHDKCVWVNDIRQDFIYFIQSRHPLISCLQCPVKHPYSKQQRRSTLIIMFCLGSILSFMASLFSLYGSPFTDFNLQDLNQPNELFLFQLLCSVWNAVILWFCDVCVTKIHSCSCADRPRTAFMAVLCKVLTTMTTWLYFVISLFIFSCSMYMVIELELVHIYFKIFALQFLCSWLIQFFALYLRFKISWIRDHKTVTENKKSPYYLTYKDYEEYTVDALRSVPSSRRINIQRSISIPSCKSKSKSIHHRPNISATPLLHDVDTMNDIVIHIES
eukprot:16955_1